MQEKKATTKVEWYKGWPSCGRTILWSLQNVTQRPMNPPLCLTHKICKKKNCICKKSLGFDDNNEVYVREILYVMMFVYVQDYVY